MGSNVVYQINHVVLPKRMNAISRTDKSARLSFNRKLFPSRRSNTEIDFRYRAGLYSDCTHSKNRSVPFYDIMLVLGVGGCLQFTHAQSHCAGSNGRIQRDAIGERVTSVVVIAGVMASCAID